jgi:hypothetical protein
MPPRDRIGSPKSMKRNWHIYSKTELSLIPLVARQDSAVWTASSTDLLLYQHQPLSEVSELTGAHSTFKGDKTMNG